MGVVFSAFSWSYALLQIPGGVFLDRFGTRITYSLALTLKSEDAFAPLLTVVLFPVLLLSGILLPMPLAPGWLERALADAKGDSAAKVIYLSPQGRKLDQAAVRELAQEEHLILIAGRYEGIDERFIETHVDEEWSIGDYVLSGGELPAMVLIDGVTRLLPGALGHADSAEQDSFTDGLLDCPHYTRPETWRGQTVPETLLSGNHGHIERWRR